MKKYIISIIAIFFMVVSNFVLNQDSPTPLPMQTPTPGFAVGINTSIEVDGFATAKQSLAKSLNIKSLRIEYGDDLDYDAAINWAAQNGVSILMMLGDDYNLGNVTTDASARQAYADRSAKLVKQYGNKIKYVEVWNEWNGGSGPKQDCSWPTCSPVIYTDLLCRTYKAVKAVNSNITVIGLTNANVDLSFIGQVFDNGGGNCMDIISVHPYVYAADSDYTVPYAASADTAVSQVVKAVGDIEKLAVQKVGITIPVAITEEGRDDDGDFSTQNRQITAAYITALNKRAKTIPSLVGMWWFAMIDNVDGQWGVVDSNGVKKPSFTALQQH